MKRKLVAALLGVVAVFSVLAAGIQGVNSFTEWRVAPVATSAMSPDVRNGSLIVSKLTPEKDIKAGDIVTIGVGESQRNLIGRVLEISTDDEQYYNISLKSDQRALPDEFPYKIRDVTYKEQFSVPAVGFLFSIASSPLGLILLLSAAFALGLVYIFGMHGRLSQDQRSIRHIGKARQRATRRIEERNDHNGVEEMKSFFAESEV